MEEKIATAAGSEGATNAEDFAGWNDAGFGETTETVEAGTETAKTQQDAAAQESAGAGAAEGAVTESAEGTEQQAAENQPQQAAPDTLRIRYMDEEKEISREEAVVLAQKGMDYDRIRGKWDDVKDLVAFVDEQAKAAGMDRKAFIDFLRIETKKSQGMGEEEARRTVDMENREAVVARKESEEQQRIANQQAQQQAAEAAQRERDADFRRFAMKFPDVDPKTIGPDVWERVGKGERLTEIWLEKENERLRQEQAAAEQNAKNAGRSTGSMASSGGETQKKDPFDEGWD